MTDKKAVAEAASRLLADSYTLYLKTHNFHWNVTGPQFSSLHTLFETQYTDLALAVDEIAERVRALGFPAPGSYTEFSELATVKEAVGPRKAREMLAELLEDQQIVTNTASDLVKRAQDAGDEVSADLGIGRSTVHEKNAWMLRSHLED